MKIQKNESISQISSDESLLCKEKKYFVDYFCLIAEMQKHLSFPESYESFQLTGDIFFIILGFVFDGETVGASCLETELDAFQF